MSDLRNNPKDSHQNAQQTPIRNLPPAGDPTQHDDAARLRVSHDRTTNRTRACDDEELAEVDQTREETRETNQKVLVRGYVRPHREPIDERDEVQ